MTNIYEELSWLPPAPADFPQRLARAITGQDLAQLATYSLDDNQLRRLSKKLDELKKSDRYAASLRDVTLGIVSNATTQLVAPALKGSALRFGLALEVVQTEFNQIAQIAYSGQDTFSSQAMDVVLISIDHQGLPFVQCPGDSSNASNQLQDCLQYLMTLADALHRKSNAHILLQNFAPLSENLSGSFERRLTGTWSWLLHNLNRELDLLNRSYITVVDIAGLAANVGLANWHDPTLWHIGKLSFAQRFNPVYGDWIARIVAARLGRSRRCLILDLDNTLWGGVIGDDGLEGIKIGQGDPTGEAHLSLQRTALDFRDRGIVLAVSSKNEDATARSPFREHPDMLLREDHIAVFQANWSDKASNIRAIATTLSLGLESMVFVDDNPAERLQVRQALPEVAVPELPDDPALFSRTLIAAGYFESVSFSEEDRKRATFYQDNAMRAAILNQSVDLESYLKSLAMEITFSPFNEVGIQRITQLISKSNQFNLTTKRYSEAEVTRLMGDPGYFTLQIRLKDTLGDNGMISVVICKLGSETWEIDTWLMSCRVLGRRVEEATLAYISEHAKSGGVNKIKGYYIPTARNALVKDHYKNLGFVQVTGDAGPEVWELDLTQYQYPSLPIKISDSLNTSN